VHLPTDRANASTHVHFCVVQALLLDLVLSL